MLIRIRLIISFIWKDPVPAEQKTDKGPIVLIEQLSKIRLAFEQKKSSTLTRRAFAFWEKIKQ